MKERDGLATVSPSTVSADISNAKIIIRNSVIYPLSSLLDGGQCVYVSLSCGPRTLTYYKFLFERRDVTESVRV